MSQTVVKFPLLEQYVQCWPLTDLIRMRLKYTSGREHCLKALRISEDISLAVATSKLTIAQKTQDKAIIKSK